MGNSDETSDVVCSRAYPVRLLLARRRDDRYGRLPSVLGMLPVRLLLPSAMWVRLAALARLGGMLPAIEAVHFLTFNKHTNTFLTAKQRLHSRRGKSCAWLTCQQWVVAQIEGHQRACGVDGVWDAACEIVPAPEDSLQGVSWSATGS